MAKINKSKIGYILLKIFVVFIMFFVLISTNFKVFANSDSFSLGDVINRAQEFVNKGKEGEQTANEMATQIQPIINTIYWLGVAVVIGASMYLGVQYFAAGGDASSRAEIKKKLIGFLISSAVLIAAFPIWKFVVSIVQSASPVQF